MLTITGIAIGDNFGNTFQNEQEGSDFIANPEDPNIITFRVCQWHLHTKEDRGKKNEEEDCVVKMAVANCSRNCFSESAIGCKQAHCFAFEFEILFLIVAQTRFQLEFLYLSHGDDGHRFHPDQRLLAYGLLFYLFLQL